MKTLFAGLIGLIFYLPFSAAASWMPAIDPAQLECLALVIYWEARSESEIDQSAVAHVTLNRASHPQFPDDVCDVVKQGGAAKRGNCQFSWWCDGRDDTPRELDAWDAAQGRAIEVLKGVSADPTGGAVYFHNKRVKPKWSSVKERTKVIGKHIFYR